MDLATESDLYYKLYKTAKEKAKIIRNQSINAYLEAKSINDNNLLEELDYSSSEDESLFSEPEDDY